MANFPEPTLDALFQSLADPTRRAVIARLGKGPAAVGELAAPHDMALPSFLKHIRQLEKSGLVTSQKHGRQRVCILHPKAMAAASDWLAEQQRLWEQRFDRMDAVALQVAQDMTTNDQKE